MALIVRAERRWSVKGFHLGYQRNQGKPGLERPQTCNPAGSGLPLPRQWLI